MVADRQRVISSCDIGFNSQLSVASRRCDAPMNSQSANWRTGAPRSPLLAHKLAPAAVIFLLLLVLFLDSSRRVQFVSRAFGQVAGGGYWMARDALRVQKFIRLKRPPLSRSLPLSCHWRRRVKVTPKMKCSVGQSSSKRGGRTRTQTCEQQHQHESANILIWPAPQAPAWRAAASPLCHIQIRSAGNWTCGLAWSCVCVFVLATDRC